MTEARKSDPERASTSPSHAPAQVSAHLSAFRSTYHHGLARVAACSIPIQLAQPLANARAVLEMAQSCHDDGVALAVFSELTLSGYSIEDLLLQDVVLDAVREAIALILDGSTHLDTVLIVGAPLVHDDRVFNTAVVMHRGRVLGIVPKSYLPNYREFYERRQVASGAGMHGQISLRLPRTPTTVAGGSAALSAQLLSASLSASGDAMARTLTVPFGSRLLFAADDHPGFVFHVEVCEDFWVPIPPSAEAALAGATILTNLSGSPITIGRADSRRLLAESASARCLSAYIYAAAGAGESTTDVAWDGQLMIFENGVRLAEGERFQPNAQSIVADVDLTLLRQERMRMGTFDDNRRCHATRPDAGAAGETVDTRDASASTAQRVDGFRRIAFTLAPPCTDIGLKRRVERFPFVPSDPARLSQDCYEAYNIQVAALVQRLQTAKLKRVVIGISGGLDSTHALIVAAKAFDHLGLPRANILTYTMPGFATGDKSKGLAWRLMRSLGTTSRELDIRPAATQMLSDLEHPFGRGESVYDVTFENVQAGLRTDYLFRLANHHGAIVIGTGDLSELALGWCTYGVGDQMAHYNVNSGVPKTLMQHLIRWAMGTGQFSEEVNAVLGEILSSEISPELVPAVEGKPQSTESLIGPYALHDFFLFYIVRYGMRPSKVAFLAWHAWSDAQRGGWPTNFPEAERRAFTLDEICHWLEGFLQRFFGFSQFKRSAMPNGPKISAGGALSPRGDWRAPSDGNAQAWIDELRRALPLDARGD